MVTEATRHERRAVRWTDGAGMGVQFIGVDVDVLLEPNNYFATLG